MSKRLEEIRPEQGALHTIIDIEMNGYRDHHTRNRQVLTRGHRHAAGEIFMDDSGTIDTSQSYAMNDVHPVPTIQPPPEDPQTRMLVEGLAQVTSTIFV